MKEITKDIFKKIMLQAPDSHKGQNGRLLVIAGSEKFHGAFLLSLQGASRIVDMVYVHSVAQNLSLIDTLRKDLATFIPIEKKELEQTIGLVDAIVVGPGMEESEETFSLVKYLLTKRKDKKIIIDATALWHVDPRLLHQNCIVTPHSREFEQVFQCEANAENALLMSKKFGCIVVLTGQHDYVSNGDDLWENNTGNVGMTKGGTGDVLVGLIGALATTNNLLDAALAGVHLNGLAGDALYKRFGTFYNAEDLATSVGQVWKENIMN